MESKRGIVEIFGKCYRLLNKLILNLKNSSLSDLLTKKSDNLLSEFIIFLNDRKYWDKKNSEGTYNVAQYYKLKRLTFEIKSIIDLLEILLTLNIISANPLLSLERDLLSLKLNVLNFSFSKKMPDKKRESEDNEGKKIIKVAETKPQKPKVRTKKEKIPLEKIRKEVLDFIKNNGRVSTIDLLNGLPDLSQRTIQRRTSELVRSGIINKFNDGRKTSYESSIASQSSSN